MEDKTWIILTALLCATVVMCVALALGIDGLLLAGFLTIIGSVVGVPAGIVLERKRKG